PAPTFLQLRSAHREARSQLLDGAQERKGFIVLTGKVGTGKTTLLHALRQRLNGQTAISFVVNSSLAFDGILEYVLADLEIGTGGESRAKRLINRKSVGEGKAIVQKRLRRRSRTPR